MLEPFVMVVNRNGQNFLSQILANNVLVKMRLDLCRNRERSLHLGKLFFSAPIADNLIG
jgi:hypothetical protein